MDPYVTSRYTIDWLATFAPLLLAWLGWRDKWRMPRPFLRWIACACCMVVVQGIAEQLSVVETKRELWASMFTVGIHAWIAAAMLILEILLTPRVPPRQFARAVARTTHWLRP